MRVDGNRIYFRQSWVNEYFICPERARQTALCEPTDETNEAAALGTAMHAGIEAAMDGRADSPDAVFEIARFTLDSMYSLGLFVYDDLTPKKAHDYLRLWSQQLRTVSEFRELYDDAGKMTEQSFCVHVDTRADGTEMWWEGTVDVVGSLYLVDWKTSGRQYQAWEKQRWAIQPTMYAHAAERMGWLHYPVDFRYVVFDKGAKPPQVVQVQRGPEHAKFLTAQLWLVYDQDWKRPWPLNDQHALCSPKWCPHWEECKGLYVSPDFKPKDRT